MRDIVLALYALTQVAYTATLAVVLWLFAQPVDEIDRRDCDDPGDRSPRIVLLYPVLRELEETMRTTMLGLSRATYAADRLRVVALPNADDIETIASLESLRRDFTFLEVVAVPPTTDSGWENVWRAWGANPKAYWWRDGPHAGDARLPPKKTRQLVYACYRLAPASHGALLSYIDADSVVPEDYFRTAAGAARRYDVIQNTNVAGNALHTPAATMFAMDHMTWDGSLYPHMTAHGRQPYWVLGKGLFMWFDDLVEIGGFNPWLTIEDPELGMRLWTNGRRLGVVRSPLIEEVPLTFRQGIVQRKRWIAGFLQSLGRPLRQMGMSASQRFRARLNFVPCASLLLAPAGLPLGAWALVQALDDDPRSIGAVLEVVSIANILAFVLVIAIHQKAAWRQTALVLPRRRDRLRFMLRVNPLLLWLYYIWWTIPLLSGVLMYLRRAGQVWERTEKVDANHDLVRRARRSAAPDGPLG